MNTNEICKSHYATFDKHRQVWVCKDCGAVVPRPGENTDRALNRLI